MTKDDIQEIFSSFADPATPIEVTVRSNSARICVIRDAEEREYLLNLASGEIVARHDNSKKYISINSLLASNEFAGLKSFAATQMRTLSGLSSSDYLPPNLLVHGKKTTGFESLEAETQNRSEDKIKVVLLDGPAGVGKTHLLKLLTFIRAEKYQRQPDIPPLLYVSSRGRRMSNLRDALAGATQLLRARFTFEQVPILVKRGLLQLVIDGFDELVDADGYHDAWHALREFLDELGTGGVCLLAGRDTFFDEQGFIKRMEAITGRLHLAQAHLLPVTPRAARKWLLDHNWPIGEVDSEEAKEVLVDDSYALRPFFLSALTEAKGWATVLAKGSTRAYLVDRFLDREAQIIETMVTISSSNAYQALCRMFEEAALDMAERESEEVDIEYLSFLAEVAFSGRLGADDIKKLQHKAGSFALLEKSSQERLRRFPHSEIRNYFLSRGIIRVVGEGTIPLVLRRGVLGSDFLEVFIEVVDEGGHNLQSFFSNLKAALAREVSGDRMHHNAAAILLSSMAAQDPSIPQTLVDLTAYEAVLYGSLSERTMENVSIDRLDVRGCDMTRVRFRNCHVASLVVDEGTRFSDSFPTTHTIQEMRPEGAQVLRSQSDIASWFMQHSIPEGGNSTDNLALVKFFDKVCRRSLRQFYLSPGGDDPSSSLLEDDLWPEVQSVLERHSRIQIFYKQTGGPQMPLTHVKEPRSLLNPSVADAESRQIRAEIILRASELEQRMAD